MTPTIEKALIDFANGEIGLPFQWGYRCCNTVALRALDIITGGDHAGPVLHQFDSALSAETFQKQYRRMSRIIADAGGRQVAAGFEQTGDFLILPGLHWDFVSVVIGGKALCATTHEGVRMFPLCRVRYSQVWRVPCRP